jgi:hypothetical protein
MFHISDGDNASAIEIRLTKEDVADLDRGFPSPRA